MTLKPYMYFSRHEGQQEAAVLIFAHTAKEAKKVAWKEIGDLFVYDYTDIGIRLLRNSDYLFDNADPKLVASDTPHAIDSPKGCEQCELWGDELVDGRCQSCRDNDLDKYGGL